MEKSKTTKIIATKKNKEEEKSEPLKIRIFDANIIGSCSSCCGGGCGNPTMHEMEVMAAELLKKHGIERLKFEVYDFFRSPGIIDKKVNMLVKDKGEEALPAIMIGDELVFSEKLPSIRELDAEVSKRLAHGK